MSAEGQWNIITGAEIDKAIGSPSLGNNKTTLSSPTRKPSPWSLSNQTLPCSVSSNNFANGTDQNVGNVITDRRMIRINAPPGGNSTFSISTMFGDCSRDDRFTR